MKTHAATLFTVLISMLAAVGCQDEPQVYCGSRLSKVLALLCENGLIKRSDPSLEAWSAVEPHAFPWIPAHHARSLGRSKRQVVSECCFKPCTIDELSAYCA